MRYSFKNDYSEIAHENILKALLNAKNEQNNGYSLDSHSANAIKRIKEVFSIVNSDVHFLSGGTVANMTLISYALRPYEAVICTNEGHINVHETGAVEGSGHKIIAVNGINGKITVKNIMDVLSCYTDEHMVLPKMVYISDSTEIGSIYKKSELEEIYSFCKNNGLFLFIDGARLASALGSKYNDINKEDLKDLCDAFYIGGTKIGLMYGEALVINNDLLKENFRYHVKNRGAMLAKGFILGIEFEEIFKDNLYFKLGKMENEMASYLASGLEELGYKLAYRQETNQVFVFMDKSKQNYLKNEFLFEVWDNKNDVIRLVTSFNTKKENIDELLSYLKKRN